MGLHLPENEGRKGDIMVNVGCLVHFRGRSKLAAQLILLHFMIDIPQKAIWVSAYTFCMSQAMDTA